MKFLIIIPAHNEEKNILYCLKSLENQTYKDFKVVVVNDGSTDKTQRKAEMFVTEPLSQSPFIIYNLAESEHEPGAKVVRTFNKGLELQSLDSFDIICKFDADVIFPENYLEEVAKVYQENPKAGMVSGLVRIKKSVLDYSLAFDFDEEKSKWKFENISSPQHVRGPIKSYRKECFLAMNGLRPVLGWDNIDSMLAKMHGYEVVTIKNLWVKHIRPTAYKYKNQKAEKLGAYFYNIGLNTPLTLISAMKVAMKDHSFYEFRTIMKSFFSQTQERSLTKEEIAFIRKLRWKEMLHKIF